MKRHEPTEAEIREEISKEFDRWNNIAVNGCQDPGYPDGVNMNLVRNHIIYRYRQLEEIGALLFNLFGEPVEERAIPPKVPENYMIQGTQFSHRLDKWYGTMLNRGLVYGQSGEYRA